MIEVSHLTKRYGTHTAIADLSFHIEKGQIYACSPQWGRKVHHHEHHDGMSVRLVGFRHRGWA